MVKNWRNGAVFITAQFVSRFANAFLTTAVRFELLETGGVSTFASAQVLNQIARLFMSQIAGLLADNFQKKRLYIMGEAFNLVFVAALLLSRFGLTTGLIAVNVGVGLTQAFIQPVAKSMPPLVVPEEELAIVNSWDLTGDKIARNLAPMVFAFASSTSGFQTAICFCLVLYASVLIIKQILDVDESFVSEKNGKIANGANGTSGMNASVAMRRLLSVFRQIWEGLLTLGTDRTIGLLIVNTLVTNVLVYPVSSVVFPVIFKEIPEGSIEQEGTRISEAILYLQRVLGVNKKKAWMNYAAIVSLGGVIGPFLSGVLVYRVKAYTSRYKERINWIGLNLGISGQIITLAPLLVALYFVRHVTAGMRVLLLFLVMAPQTAANNVTTIYFSSHTQQRLNSSERGRFLANILMLFTLGNSVGTLLYGWALAANTPEAQIVTSTLILFAALVIKVFLLVAMRVDSSVQVSILLKKDQ